MIERTTDAILLKRFAERREETAFAELVQRHGPLVQRVCRRFLRSEHDVEDVFQATFLLLALRASDVAWESSVGGWVQAVARRLALHTRTEVAKRRSREVSASSLGGVSSFDDAGILPGRECPASVFADEVEHQDARQALDTAVEELPEKYRAPLVLCYLEGKTNHEAALQLGYPVGSMSRRLERARGLLRKRLIGCGVTLALAVCLVSLLSSLTRHTDGRNGRELDPIRGAMAVFSPDSSRRMDLRELLGSLERNDRGFLDRERLQQTADHAVRVADEIATLAPVGRDEVWRGYAGEMKLAALELSRLQRDGGQADLLVSVRRLNATCVQCHTTFQ